MTPKFQAPKFSFRAWLWCVARKCFTFGRVNHCWSNAQELPGDPRWLDHVSYHPRTKAPIIVQRQEIRTVQFCEDCGKRFNATGYNQRPHPLHATELDTNLAAQTGKDFSNEKTNRDANELRRNSR